MCPPCPRTCVHHVSGLNTDISRWRGGTGTVAIECPRPERAQDRKSGNQRYCWQTQKMSDKLQFVVVFGSARVMEASDKLKFVGHFHRPFALLPSLSAV